jgi:hypothetical protein
MPLESDNSQGIERGLTDIALALGRPAPLPPVLASMYMSATHLNLTTGVYYTLEVDTVLFDLGNNFNPATYTFTFPEDGYYMVQISVEYEASSVIALKRYVAKLVKNGSIAVMYDSAHSGVAGGLMVRNTTVLFFAKGDTVVLQAKNDSGANTVDILGSITTGFVVMRVA